MDRPVQGLGQGQGQDQGQGQGLRRRAIGQQTTPPAQQRGPKLAAAAVGAVIQIPGLSLPTLALAAGANIVLATVSSSIPSTSDQGQQGFVSAIPPNATNVFDNVSRVVGSAALATLAPFVFEAITGVPAKTIATVTYGAFTLAQVADVAMKISAARSVAGTT